MRVVIQRVSEASVRIQGEITAEIRRGLLILLGIEENDKQEDADWLVQKILGMRIFADAEDKMNLDLGQIEGDVLVVSQFTLHALTKKGNRPSYLKAAKPEIAVPLYTQFVAQFETELHKEVGTGEFGADMKVALINDGPVTIMIDSKNKE